MRQEKDEILLYIRGKAKIVRCIETEKLMSLVSLLYSTKSSLKHLSADLRNLGASRKDRKYVKRFVKALVRMLISKKLRSIRGLNSQQKTRVVDFLKLEFPLLSGFLTRD